MSVIETYFFFLLLTLVAKLFIGDKFVAAEAETEDESMEGKDSIS